MKKLHITGGQRLNGTIRISGAKNSALPILFACALNKETCVLYNVPPVQDIHTTVDILRQMGVTIHYKTATTLEVNGAGFTACSAPDDLVKCIRASSYLWGVELARENKTKTAWPGGCEFGPGSRPFDYHMRAFEYMGAEMTTASYISGEAKDGMHDARILLDGASVGATVNIMLAASLIPGGDTVIVNAAREPHIIDLAMFLTKCGATVKGAGTSEIHIYGTESLHACQHTIIPDMIEAGTYMAAVAGTGGCLRLENLICKHMDSVSSKLMDMGCKVEESPNGDAITVTSLGVLNPVQIKTDVYPGFPTDMHPQLAVLLAVAQGTSKMAEKVFPTRFAYLYELRKMGAQVVHENLSSEATFLGPSRLFGATVQAPDLRAGAALVIAALMADGESDILAPEKIERGYDDMIGKLRSVGADICEINLPDSLHTSSLSSQFS